jgi:transcriptional regulator
MYLPAHFEEHRPEVLHALMREYPLATIVMDTENGLEANHIPLQLVASTADATKGILQGHVARANPLWKTARPETDVLVIFQGPQAYVSPAWYPSKIQHGKVVPTWNYVAVHARGRLLVRDDPHWLRSFLNGLVATHESSVDSLWAMDDAPADYVDKMLAAIVGFEIQITSLIGKWKVSQNRSLADRAGVAIALNQTKQIEKIAMAELVAPPHDD